MGKNKSATGFLLFIAILIMGFSAKAQQAGTKPVKINFKDLVGKWTYQATTPYIVTPKSTAKPATTPATTPADTSKSSAAPRLVDPGVKLDKNKFAPMHKASTTFNNANLEFTANKTCVKTHAENSVTYTWKTSGKNILYFKTQQSKDKTKMEIKKLNSDTLQLTQTFDVGSLTFFYLREK